MAETKVARSSGSNAKSLDARVGNLILGIMRRNDLTVAQKNRYYRMVQRAGQRMAQQ